MEHDITRLLIEWRQGSTAALDTLSPGISDELHRIASRQMARERGNDAWIQVAHGATLEVTDRAHFQATAARVMRQAGAQYARSHKSEERGAGGRGASSDCDPLALDLAMAKLALEDERKSRIVELKSFGGLSNEEIAEGIVMSVITERRDLQVAHALMQWQMSGSSTQRRLADKPTSPAQ